MSEELVSYHVGTDEQISTIDEIPRIAPRINPEPINIRDIEAISDMDQKLFRKNVANVASAHDRDTMDRLGRPQAEDFSFAVHDDTGKTVGYCLAYVDNRTPNIPILCVDRIGTLPEARSSWLGISIFEELLARARQYDVKGLVMDARESTSYKGVNSKFGGKMLDNFGYKLIDHGVVNPRRFSKIKYSPDETYYRIELVRQ